MRGIERFPRRPVQRVGMAIVLALILVAPFVAQNSAQAQPALLVVMNLNDSGTGSLRQAIADIAAGGEIIFDVGLSGTIGLTSELVIDRNLTITGPGAAVIALSGQGETRVVRVSGAEVAIAGLTVRDGDSSSNTGGGMLNDGGSLTLTRVVVTGNESAGDGGGIGNVNNGTLHLVNTTVSGNTARGIGGGGIYNIGTLTLTESTVSGNTAIGTEVVGSGGGIFNVDGVITVTDSTVTGNTSGGAGGGIDSSIGKVTVTNSTFSENTAFAGGGIYVGGSASTFALTNSVVSGNTASAFGGGIVSSSIATISNSDVVGNTAGTNSGGILNLKTLTLIDSRVTGNTAGAEAGGISSIGATLTLIHSNVSENITDGRAAGIFSSGSTVSLIDSTVAENTAAGDGGGIHNRADSTLTITSSTVWGNSTSTAGGGIYNENGEVTLTSSTVAGNTATSSGSGLYQSSGIVEVTGTILASAASTTPVCNTTLGGSYNLSTDASCFVHDGMNLLDTDPQLGLLADNGGLTATMLPAPASPAVDAIPAMDCPTSADQRGVPRPQGGACDIGAVEVIVPPALTLPDDIAVDATSMVGAAVEFEVFAFDGAGEPLAAECDAASGDIFNIGTTPVNCWAEDGWGNLVEGSFTVTVLGGAGQLAALIAEVQDGEIPAFLKPRLLVFLNTASLALERDQMGAACHTLQMFAEQLEVLSPRYIAAGPADEWQARVQSIRAVLGCS